MPNMKTHDEKLTELCEAVARIETKLEIVKLPLPCELHQKRLDGINGSIEKINVSITAINEWRWQIIGAAITISTVASLIIAFLAVPFVSDYLKDQQIKKKPTTTIIDTNNFLFGNNL